MTTPSRQEIHGRRRQNKNKKKKRRRGGWTTWLGVLLILIALGLFAIDPIKNHMIKNAAEVNSVMNLDRDQIARNQEADVTYDFGDIKQLNAFDVLRENVNPHDLPTIGGIAIPSVGMNLPIYKGASNEGMYLGAGTLDPDQEMGHSNYPLASHHSIHKDLLFAPLLRVNFGDDIYLTDLENIYHYTIDFIEDVPAERVDLIAPTDDDIVTLVTCDTSLTSRIVVQGSLAEIIDIDHAPQTMLNAFGIDQTVPD